MDRMKAMLLTVCIILIYSVVIGFIYKYGRKFFKKNKKNNH
ncbi:hypothetical protein [Clostridium weizhouense]|nr:hypothetical protein [Clostridium weizhouense]